MSMIFGFTEMDRAEAFVAQVKERFGLDGQTFDDEEESYKHAQYPFELTPPVAHINRTCDDDVRDQVGALAISFGGKFIGT